jgi:ankyrin repeat protein
MTHEQPPFPTPIEIVRFIINSLDIGKYVNKKELNERAQDPFISLDQSLEYFLINGPLHKELSDFLKCDELASILCEEFKQLLCDYIKVILPYDANGLNRWQILMYLAMYKLPDPLKNTYRNIIGPVTKTTIDQLIANHTNALGLAMSLLEHRDEEWRSIISKQTKEERDKLGKWKSGTHLPDLSSLKAMFTSNNISTSTRALLLIARGLDYLNKQAENQFFKLIIESKNQSPESFGYRIREANRQQQVQLGHVMTDVAEIQKFITNRERTHLDAEKVLKTISNVRSVIEKNKNDQLKNHWCDFQSAKAHTFLGNFEEAKRYANNALKGYAYRSLNDIDHVLQFSLGLAASQGPDKVLCKNIRKLMNTFDVTAHTNSTSINSAKAEDHIQNWEIDLWAFEFNKLYNPLENEKNGHKPGPLIVNDIDIKYNLKKPDQILTLKTDNGYKRIPQLIRAIELDDYKVFDEILNAGASVNCYTSSGDTPLIVALDYLQHQTLNKSSRYIDRLMKYDYKTEVVNAVTQKIRLNALHLAVKAGSIKVVNFLIKQGADVNIIATTDNMSPLYHCIQVAALAAGKSNIPALNTTDPHTQDALNRHSNTLYGMEIFDQIKKDKLGTISSEIMLGIMLNSYRNIPIGDYHKIMSLLLENGADPDQEHQWPIAGYTPLMIATENGNTTAFIMLIKHGGDLKKTYYWPPKRSYITLHDIATHYDKPEILRVLEEI